MAFSLIATPSTSGKVVLSSGDTVNLQYATDWTAPYATMFSLPKTKAGTYSIKSANNACGPMAVEGQVNIKVNPVDFMPVSISPSFPCAGGEVKVLFRTAGGEFNANTKFRIRFVGDNVNFGTFFYRDVPATLTGKNQLTARVPDNFYGGSIYLGIVAENPAAVSINKALRFYINEKSTFKLTTQKPVIDLGETTDVSANPTGWWPFKITFTSGEVTESWLQVRPEKTTTYQVKTYESGCGVTQDPPNSTLTITVRPSLLLADPSRTGDPQIVCEGKTVRLGFKAAGVTSQTTYSVQASNYSPKEIALFPAKVVGDSVEFFIPKNTSQDPDLNYDQISALRLVSANPALSSPMIPFKIQSPPTMVLTGPQPGVPFPSAARLDFDLRGGTPYTVELANGSKEVYDQRNVWFEQFVKRDTVFKVAKLSNACFSNSNPPSFPIKVTNPSGTTPNVFARLITKKTYCMSDSVEVEIGFSGKFEAGNVFTLSYLRNAQSTTYPIRQITKPGISSVATFGTRSGAAFASTSATSDDQGNAKAVVLLTGTGPWRYSYGNDLGAVNRYAATSPDTLLITSKEPSAYFKLLSVTNGCGAGTISEPSTIQVEVILGTEERGHNKELLAFGPNPTGGRIVLRFKTASRRELTLYHANGTLLRTKVISGTETEVDMHEYPAGTYLLKIGDPKRGQVLKIVKE
ncbi:Por secretion system C-terminal sorting domain-containing protein [Dyadobacter soli]|uniref:Por secretion system C-terminal sorting domain-containing protein n=1 Tax=Dyadobacter soli TaxID=659014 RepID=A0A1G7GEG6_9BACT|nr:T9SS type A sorting domain-containing protein [Dyadobacter soli]SDE86532.1 Por secretion system C-terminal sorting domain-containing protein [Dyadobacter soli]